MLGLLGIRCERCPGRPRRSFAQTHCEGSGSSAGWRSCRGDFDDWLRRLLSYLSLNDQRYSMIAHHYLEHAPEAATKDHMAQFCEYDVQSEAPTKAADYLANVVCNLVLQLKSERYQVDYLRKVVGDPWQPRGPEADYLLFVVPNPPVGFPSVLHGPLRRDPTAHPTSGPEGTSGESGGLRRARDGDEGAEPQPTRRRSTSPPPRMRVAHLCLDLLLVA